MSTLTEILKDLFYNSDQPAELLKKYQLFDYFENSIASITEEIGRKPINVRRFGNIASAILVSVNTKLRGIADPIEKGYLESIIKDIANELLLKVITSSNNKEKILPEIISALETVSSIQGYNFQALISLLKLKSSAPLLTYSIEEKGFYYQWNGNENDLDELIRNLKSQNWIVSVKEFKKLFRQHDGNLQVMFSPEKLTELVALFDVLKAMRLITPKGCRGHFHPLKTYLVDFENKLLFKSDPKKIKMLAKRGVNRWAEHSRKAEKWVEGFKVKDTFKLPLPR